MAYPPSLNAALVRMPFRTRNAFLQHLEGGTSADLLADWLRRYGTPVSATTIRTYRRARKAEQ